MDSWTAELGRDCLELVRKLDFTIFDYHSTIKTGDGKNQSIIGKVCVDIECNKKTENIVLYLVPSLNRVLYLGIDFWKLFIIVSFFLESVDSDPVAENSKSHRLTTSQEILLEKANSEFRCYTRYGLGKTHLEKHVIDTGDAPAKKMRYYPISPAVQKLTYEELDRILALKVIEPAINAACNNRTTLVMKLGKNRLCLDARELNQVTTKNTYPLPNIDGLLSRLGNTIFISAVDLKDAFWQIPLEESSRSKTAFTVQGKPHYQFTVMPFVFCNAT